MIDYRLALMCGTDIPVPECQIIVHQPTIKEISLIGEQDFFVGAQCLCINKNMVSKDEIILENTTNFQVFMTIMSQKETKDKKDAVIQLLSLMLPNHKVIFTPQSMILKPDNEEMIMIDEDNFEVLQEVFKKILCFSSGVGQESYNPGNEKAREIAEKLMRGRQRIAEEKGEDQGSALVQYTSALAVGLNSMSLKDVINLTIYQLYDLIQRYSLWVNWDLDIRTRLAGGKPDAQPDNWMKNIH